MVSLAGASYATQRAVVHASVSFSTHGCVVALKYQVTEEGADRNGGGDMYTRARAEMLGSFRGGGGMKLADERSLGEARNGGREGE